MTAGRWTTTTKQDNTFYDLDFDNEREAFEYAAWCLQDGEALPQEIRGPSAEVVWRFDSRDPVSWEDNLRELQERARKEDRETMAPDGAFEELVRKAKGMDDFDVLTKDREIHAVRQGLWEGRKFQVEVFDAWPAVYGRALARGLVYFMVDPGVWSAPMEVEVEAVADGLEMELRVVGIAGAWERIKED